MKGSKCHTVMNKNDFLVTVIVIIVNIHNSKVAYLLMKVL